MPDKDELLEACLRAVYAGWKYRLALEHATDRYMEGEPNTPHNDALVEKYAQLWREATREAIEMHQSMSP